MSETQILDDLTLLKRSLMCLKTAPYDKIKEIIGRLIDELKEGKSVVVTLICECLRKGVVANDRLLFNALGECATTRPAYRPYIYEKLLEVCPNPSKVFTFLYYESKCNGNRRPRMGRSLRKLVSRWFLSKTPATLAMHVTKYRRRRGWTHLDLLRLAHVNPAPVSLAMSLVLKYIAKEFKGAKEQFEGLSEADNSGEVKEIFEFLKAVETVRHSNDEHEVARLIEKFRLVHEHVPTWLKKSKEVWRALIQHMPVKATLRNLTRLSTLGLLDDSKPDNCIELIVDRFKDHDQLRAAGIHPVSILLALKEYEGFQLHSTRVLKKRQRIRGIPFINPESTPLLEVNGTINLAEDTGPKHIPCRAIVSALNDAFYACFDTIKPTGKRLLIAIDLSQSMSCGGVIGASHITPANAAAAAALILLRCEMIGTCQIIGVTAGDIQSLDIEPNSKLGDVSEALTALPSTSATGAGTQDRSLFSRVTNWARDKNELVDAFIVFTASAGGSMTGESVKDALRQYHTNTRQYSTRLAVVSLTTLLPIEIDSQGGDPRLIGLAGFEPTVLEVIRSFVVGDLDPVVAAAGA